MLQDGLNASQATLTRNQSVTRRAVANRLAFQLHQKKSGEGNRWKTSTYVHRGVCVCVLDVILGETYFDFPGVFKSSYL